MRSRLRHSDLELVRWLVAVMSCACWLGFASDARAFSDPSLYGMYPSQKIGRGGGRYFTGSPADGYGCAVCHTAPVDYHFPLYQTGLPVDGYLPDTEYTVRLLWPEAAGWALRFGTPMTALTAEFVAEDGGSAGTFEHAPKVLHQPGEACTAQPGEMGVQLAQNIMQVDPGVDPVALPLDPTNQEPCTADGKGERRCVLTVRPCGASETQMRWRSPATLSGPIWFSAGFVATDTKSTKPNDADYVTELSIAINPVVDGATHESTLTGGCSVSDRWLGRPSGDQRAPHGPRALIAWLVLASLACVARVRARLRQRVAGLASAAPAVGVRVSALVAGLGALTAGGCVEAPEPESDHVRNYSVVGLFEPTARLDSGTTKVTYKCPFETVRGVEDDAGADKKSTAPKLKPMSGTLSISFSTIPPLGGMAAYDKNGMTPNYGVIWIEDPMRNYVKTLALWGVDYVATSLTMYSLNTRKGCARDSADVVTSPTLQSHVAHSLTWSGKNIDDGIVPQGSYVLWLELEVQENPHIEPVQVPLELGDVPWTKLIPSTPLHKDLTVTYTPKR
jgi:hypothetical protein